VLPCVFPTRRVFGRSGLGPPCKQIAACPCPIDPRGDRRPRIRSSRNGDPGRTRTCNLSLRRGLLYPVEPRGHACCSGRFGPVTQHRPRRGLRPCGRRGVSSRGRLMFRNPDLRGRNPFRRQAPDDASRRGRGRGRVGNDRQPRAAPARRRVGKDARTGVRRRPGAGLRAQQDRGRAGLEPGQPRRRGDPVAQQHGVSRRPRRHRVGAGRHAAATRCGHVEIRSRRTKST
jgi:hypothetical protein